MKNVMKYKKIFVLGGTTEGRKISQYLVSQEIEVWLSVATDYGKALMDETQGIHLLEERLDEEAMVRLLNREKFDCVIDATHPYAQIVTQNIKSACRQTDVCYKRLLREGSIKEDGLIYFKTIKEMIPFLNKTTGSILLTTGSKDLEAFRALENYEERLYVRMLPMSETLKTATQMGYKMSHFICMQGPFSYEMNVALLKHVQASYMITKDSGDIGGVKDKIEAARTLGVQVLCLERPTKEEGLSLEALCHWLEEENNENNP